MGSLRDESLKKCVLLLREFIDEAQARDSEKGNAAQALDYLQEITAERGFGWLKGGLKHRPHAQQKSGPPLH